MYDIINVGVSAKICYNYTCICVRPEPQKQVIQDNSVCIT